MRELNVNEIRQVDGGSIGGMAAEGGAVGLIAGGALYGSLGGAALVGGFGALMGATFGAGYYGATALGAGSFGRWLGKEIYDLMHS